jgi:hypothetical protein
VSLVRDRKAVHRLCIRRDTKVERPRQRHSGRLKCCHGSIQLMWRCIVPR